MTTVEKLLKSWCRVNVRRNKSLQAMADETANVQLIKMVAQYQHSNEVVCHVLACDVIKVREMLKGG